MTAIAPLATGEDGDGGGLRMVQVSINGRVVLLPLSMLLLMQRRLGSGDSDSEPEADHGDHTVRKPWWINTGWYRSF